MEKRPSHRTVTLSATKFLAGSVVAALIFLGIGRFVSLPTWLVALEVLLTVLALFVFGSIRYRLDKNALTYGGALVIAATFFGMWWPTSALRQALYAEGLVAMWPFVQRHFLTLHGLDNLVHADAMLFILGLTFFVAAIAQTRLLETASFAILRRSRGHVPTTVAMIAALVAFASGIVDGVSMIGLMIRTMAIILLLSKTDGGAVVYTVMVSTVVTTVCGMWLAYGEPPNLIMKANLAPHLDNAFFLRYCLPLALGSYLIVAWNLRRKLRGRQVDIDSLDILDQHTADVRFLQSARHGEVLIPLEFLQEYRPLIGPQWPAVLARITQGEPLGEALVHANVPRTVRLVLLGQYVSEDLAETLDDYYMHVYGQNDHQADVSAQRLQQILQAVRRQRVRAQRLGVLSFVPFIGFLVWHAMNHDVPLFLASFAGFSVAFLAIAGTPHMRRLACREARHEFAEYVFLIPLFFAITLLQKSGFFQHISHLLHAGLEHWGASHMAFAQFAGTTLLSAILDNNVVADFAARALQGLDVTILQFFAMAQIAGYAAGGCWTHIGSAQAVVAYAFIRKEVDESFTPVQWIKLLTPIIVEIGVFMTIMVYVEGWLLGRAL